MKIQNWWKYLIIGFSLTSGLLLRLYKINGPVADWHSFRQADTASVTRNFLQNGINLLHPTYHDLSNVQSGLDNPQGYRMVEFPIYNALCVVVSKIFPSLTIEVVSRLVNITFSLGTALLIYLICLQLTSEYLPSMLAMSTFLFLPFSVYYSRSILPEPSAIFFMILTLYLFPKLPIISAIPFAVSILIKPYTAIIIFPLLVFYSIHFLNLPAGRHGLKSIFKLFIFSLVSLLPFILWRRWIQQFPEGIPKSDWLFFFDPNYRKTVWWHGYNISWIFPLVSFKPYWWRWLFYERITQLIFGAYGIIPLILGFAYRKKFTQWFASLSFLGIFIYFVIVAGGNVRHDYYQSLITPFLSIIFGFGIYYLANFVFKSKITGIVLSIIIFLATISISSGKVKDYYKINHPEIISIGAQVNQLVPQNTLIIAPFSGDTAFLYQTYHSGWPTEVYNINQLKKDHPSNPIYLVSLNNDQYRAEMEKIGKITYQDNNFKLINLTP